MTRTRGTVIWVAGNLIGALFYLHFASWVWPAPELRGTEYAMSAGDPFVWAFSALPTLVLCVVANAAVAGWILARRRSDRWRPSRLAWLIPAAWLVACGIDRAHH